MTVTAVDESVQKFIAGIEGSRRRRDAETLLEIMGRATGEKPRLWGTIIGFGTYHYEYPSGRKGDSAAAGFAPRKAASTVYMVDGVGTHADLLNQLGPHTAGVGCIYIKDLVASRPQGARNDRRPILRHIDSWHLRLASPGGPPVLTVPLVMSTQSPPISASASMSGKYPTSFEIGAYPDPIRFSTFDTSSTIRSGRSQITLSIPLPVAVTDRESVESPA